MSTRRVGQRKLLKHCCATVIYECGAKEVSSNSLTLMTELLDAFLSELAISAKRYAEQAGRTIPIPADVLAALVDIGMDLKSLAEFSQQPKKVIMPAAPSDGVPDFVVEQIFTPEPPKPRPGTVPDHLPPFPPPHTYVQTTAQSPPPLSYQLVRERLASQRRSVERALVRLLAASSNISSKEENSNDMPALFKGDPQSVPILPPRNDDQPWLRVCKNLNEDSLAASVSCGTEPAISASRSSISVHPN